jgi:hypothetical protein
MTPELARVALQLLDRAPLKGSEVPAFQAVQNALIAILTPIPKAPESGPPAAEGKA